MYMHTHAVLLGSDASTLSEDPNAAAAGAWLVIGVFTTRELQSKDMEKWRERIKWKNREAYGGAKMCWGTKVDRTIMAGETLATLLAMKSIRKLKGGETYAGTKVTLPVDNESAMRKYQTIEHRGDTELMNEANFDLHEQQNASKNEPTRAEAITEAHQCLVSASSPNMGGYKHFHRF
jgi:hypothetical protein